MKGFVLATVLALVATFPLVSQAETGAFGVQIPAQTQEVSASAKGGYVAQSLSDTFHVQKLQSSSETASAEKKVRERYLLCFRSSFGLRQCYLAWPIK